MEWQTRCEWPTRTTPKVSQVLAIPDLTTLYLTPLYSHPMHASSNEVIYWNYRLDVSSAMLTVYLRWGRLTLKWSVEPCAGIKMVIHTFFFRHTTLLVLRILSLLWVCLCDCVCVCVRVIMWLCMWLCYSPSVVRLSLSLVYVHLGSRALPLYRPAGLRGCSRNPGGQRWSGSIFLSLPLWAGHLHGREPRGTEDSSLRSDLEEDWHLILYLAQSCIIPR